MEDKSSTVRTCVWQIVGHVSSILPTGTLLGATIALRLPRHPHLDVVIFLLLAVSGLISVLVHASAFQRARLARVAIFVAFGCIVYRSRCLTEYPTSLNSLSAGLRDYAFLMGMVTSAVAMMAPDAAQARQQSESTTEEEGTLQLEPRKTQRKPSTKQSWDLASTTSHLDILSSLGSLELKFMPGPKSQYSDHSGSDESAITLSSGLMRNPGKIMEIVQWATAATSPTIGRKGDLASTEPVLHEFSA